MSANFTSGEWATWDSPLMKNRGVTGPTAAAAMTATADITRNGYAKWSEVLTTDKKRVAITLGITQEEAHANARLIAAAPCLLVALRLMLRGTKEDCGRICMPTDEAVHAAFAAIRKATGEQP